MVFVINQIIIGWVINLMLFWVNFDNGNYIGTSAAIGALVLAYFHEGLNAGLWAHLGQGRTESTTDAAKRRLIQTGLFLGIIALLALSFIDYYVNA